MSSQRTIIKFEKLNDDYTILKIDSPIDLDSVKDMKELTFDIDDALLKLFPNDGVYKQIGIIEIDDKKYVAKTLGFFNEHV